jgi:integrase
MPNTKPQWIPMNIEDLACYWLLTYAPAYKAASSIKRDEGMLRQYILPSFGHLALDQIVARNVEIWLLAMREHAGLSPKSCNEVLGLFSKIYNDACRWGFVQFNPLASVRKFRLPEQDFQFWSKDEVQQFLGYCKRNEQHPRIYVAVVLALYTGMRRGEIIALKWDAINWESEFITIKRAYCRTEKKVLEQTKSRKIRHVPICSALKTHLEEFKKLTWASGNVCPPIHPDCFHKEFKRLAREAKVMPMRFHDLRHTFASNFLMGGGNIYDLQQILGHSTIQVTERYAHLAPGHLSGKTEVLGF